MSEKPKIRKAQLITGLGIGSIISTVDNENFMVLSKKHWERSRRMSLEVKDDNLKQFLGVRRLVTIDKPKNSFRVQKGDINSIRFPSWHYCTICHEMSTVHHTVARLPRCSNGQCKSKSFKGRSTLIPIRLVMICNKGHIDDIPFQSLVHKDERGVDNHVLEYRTNSTKSGLSGVIINCKTCSKKTSLEGILSSDGLHRKGLKCSGHMPWVLDESRRILREDCDQKPRAVQKSSSNIYFPIMVSSIYVPKMDDLFDPRVIQFFEGNVRSTLEDLSKSLPGFEQSATVIIQGLDSDKILVDDQDLIKQAYAYFKNPPKDSGKSLKLLEYEAITSASNIKGNKDFKLKKYNLGEYDDLTQKFFKQVVLLERLKDTRAFCGFSRVLPWDESNPVMSRKKHIKQAYGSLNEVLVDEVRGEGIFVEFNDSVISEWIEHTDVIAEFMRLPELVRNDLSSRYKSPLKFLLLHSFAHGLIFQFCRFTGYSATSLRERIYVDTLEDKEAMQGVMVFTADSDAEGSLGGLVRQGKPNLWSEILQGTIEANGWCSSDPVCSDYGSQGPTSTLLSACHNCLILPETSCEHFNQFLNRRFLNTEFYDTDSGFFKP